MSVSVCVASGKGGVGKSVFTANLGAVLARRGLSVAVVDTDIGLRSQDALLSLENQVVYDLVDVAAKDCRLDQALLDHPVIPGLRLLPASQFARVKALEPDRLKKIVDELKLAHDFVLIDCPAGIERGFRNVLKAGVDQVVLMVTPDDISIRDAERAVQVVESRQMARPRIVVNRLDSSLIFSGEMYSARTVADVLDLELLGEIPEDSAVSRSVLRHALFTDYDCEARNAVIRVAARLCGNTVPLPSFGCRRPSLWRRLFSSEIKEVQPLDSH